MRSACRVCGSGTSGIRSFGACVNTDTVISLHVGSSGMSCSQNAAALYRHPLPELVLPLG